MSFKASDQAVYQLFNRNCYQMPRNQRRYVWTRRNWQELLDDILLVENGTEKTHFIGSIVLYCEKDRENGISHYTIIDGQQRITTLTTILSSIAFWLKCYDAENEFNGTKQYIIAVDDSSNSHVMVSSDYHMSLERILHAIISQPKEVITKRTINSFVDENILSKNDNSIVNAFKYYLNAISNAIADSCLSPIELLVKIRDIIINKFLYVSVIATSEEDACTVFEILNARGSVLEDHELLKNFIMRGIKPEGSVDQAKTIWAEMESDLRGNLGRFVKHYATHKYRTEQDGLSDYKVIELANKGKDTHDLLYDLKQKSKYYCRLVAPVLLGEDQNCTPVEYKVFSFFKKRRQEQIRPVLLSLIHLREQGVLSEEKYENTLLFLYDFFVCYNIIGQENSNKITNIIYSKASQLEEHYTEGTLSELVDSLCSKLPSHESFLSAFSLIGWSHHGGIYDDDRDKDRAQIVLEVLERHQSASGDCGSFTIEHIYDDNESHENGKIGNLLPLEESLNKRCNGKTFEQKLAIYSESSFALTRNFSARYSTGNQAFSIDSRARFMADEIYKEILQFKPEEAKKRVGSDSKRAAKTSREEKPKTISDIVVSGKKPQIHPENAFQETQLSLFDD